MKKNIFASMLLAASVFPALAAPLEQFGVKPGSIHRMSLGGGEITARVMETGADGWILFSVVSDDVRWRQGTRLWINLDRIGNISMPTAMPGATLAPSGATMTDSEIARLPCFSQVDAKDAQATARGQAFDRNQFLTECISSQRKKP